MRPAPATSRRFALLAILFTLSGSWAGSAEPLRALSPHEKIGSRTPAEWGQAVDSFWGPGRPADEQLVIFDRAWQALDRGYGAFMNLDVDMQALRDRWRPEIEGGVSKGRLTAIMNHLSLAMLDEHTSILSRSVNLGTDADPGTPLMLVGGWGQNARFGASLTPLPDGSLLVYRCRNNHPLGLEAGDRVLGYDGVPWKDLYPWVRTFGKATNGAFTLSDFPYLGEDWGFSRATGSGYLLDGHRYLAHTGVRPDVEVWLEPDDVRQGRDTVVEKAIQWIMRRQPRRANGRLPP